MMKGKQDFSEKNYLRKFTATYCTIRCATYIYPIYYYTEVELFTTMNIMRPLTPITVLKL